MSEDRHDCDTCGHLKTQHCFIDGQTNCKFWVPKPEPFRPLCLTMPATGPGWRISRTVDSFTVLYADREKWAVALETLAATLRDEASWTSYRKGEQ